MILWLLPSVIFSQSEWTREDKIAESIKGIKTAAQLFAEIESHRFQDEWSKVRIAFKWIERNIRYDWVKYRSGCSKGYAPDETIEKKRGVCSDYAQLFKRVLDSLRFENEVIIGNAKGYGYQQGDRFYYPDHAWNAVKDESEKWHLFDVTWGSFYFDLDPSIMIYDHLPSDSNWQLMDTVISKQKFEAMAVLPRWFVQQGIGIAAIRDACPSGECQLAEVFKIPEAFQFDAVQLPLLRQLTIGRRYSIAIKGPKNLRFLLQNGFKTKALDYRDGTHSISFVPLTPFGKVSLLIEQRNRRWTFLKWKIPAV